MLVDLYRRELNLLLGQAAEFGQNHPALAPWLGAKGSDPDVERLLEGVAYLAAVIRRQLAEGFPALAGALVDLLFPRLGQALPALTLCQFQPAVGFSETKVAPLGAQLAAIPINSVRARFALTEPVAIWPAQINRAQLTLGTNQTGVLEIRISGHSPLKNWVTEKLDLRLAGELGEACERRELIARHTRSIEVTTGSETISLSPKAIEPGGFLPALGSGRYQGYSLIREYFAFPEKFLSLRLNGLSPLRVSGESGFTARFFLENLPKNIPAIKPEHFLLNVAPAINLMTRPAQPISVDHRHDEYLIRPQKSQAENLTLHSVQKVVGVSTAGERPYLPFTGYGGLGGVGYYSIRRQEDSGSGQTEHYLTVIHPKGQRPRAAETLSLDLACYNQDLTDFLRPGDICQPTENSPAMASFANIVAPSKVCPPPADEGALWRILSHLHLSLSPLSSAENLRDLLALYAPPIDSDPTRKVATRAKIASILDIDTRTGDAFVRGWPLRGSELDVTIDGAQFSSPGEVGLFGDILDRFLADFLPLNAYLRLSITDKNSQEIRQWPIRLGSKKII
ncbi:MAG: type VI secretion system baseplate subunit TssF [Deltaproteobacteria bacterium]|jgi:type VI secretion system protein ImpG|nr:type VI secretion system baseplate subunit TssF [Deltaproteobacteria bacterium]